MGDPTSPQPNPTPGQASPQPAAFSNPTPTPPEAPTTSPVIAQTAASAHWGPITGADGQLPQGAYGGAKLARTPIGKASGELRHVCVAT